MRVRCTVEEIELDSDHSDAIESVRVTCSRCEHETESYGRSDTSVRRCAALMRQECPLGENNFYSAD